LDHLYFHNDLGEVFGL